MTTKLKFDKSGGYLGDTWKVADDKNRNKIHLVQATIFAMALECDKA